MNVVREPIDSNERIKEEKKLAHFVCSKRLLSLANASIGNIPAMYTMICFPRRASKCYRLHESKMMRFSVIIT